MQENALQRLSDASETKSSFAAKVRPGSSRRHPSPDAQSAIGCTRGADRKGWKTFDLIWDNENKQYITFSFSTSESVSKGSIDGKERLIPYLPDQVVKAVDLEQGMIEVDWDIDF